MNQKNLLAKKVPPDQLPKTLLDHTQDVVNAAETIFFRPETLFLGRWLRFFRLTEKDRPQFTANLLAACLLHDWGKANRNMQEVLQGESHGQLFWHEHISVLLLGYQGVHSWLLQRRDIDWDIVLAAVGSHHLRFADRDFVAESGQAVEVFMTHEDFQKGLIVQAATRLGLKGQPCFPPEPFWGFTGDSATFDPTELWANLRGGRLRDLTKECRKPGGARQRMLHAVRSALIVADAAGSGLPRTGHTVSEWISSRFEAIRDCTEALVREVVLRRIRQLAESSPPRWKYEVGWDSKGWNQFQKDCDTLPARSLLLAPCGAGKTLAAWRWIAARITERPVKRILFLYPTRATATEGFKDYVSWAPEADAALLHGTAAYDLEGMFPAEDTRAGKSFANTDPRLFAIRHWSKRIFSATVDQFFALLSYGYGPMCLLPLLADSIIVVDEVHSFDRGMFSALLGFLEAFDVPVLCMTATLQQGRQAQLAALLDRVYGKEDRPGELKAIACAPRYRVIRVQEAEVDDLVRKAVREGRRVLWVVNQVSRAQQAHARLAGLDAPLICYHSRFKLDDRVKQHRETVAAIRAGRTAAVAITTQVCEMSLDIDADLLVTEESPIPSSIQRMGRCNRERNPRPLHRSGEILVYKPAEEKVYSDEDLAGVDDFLAWAAGQHALSQSDLERGLEKFGSTITEAPKVNSFLASGPYAVSGDDFFRDIEAFNVPAVLASEVSAYLDAAKENQPGFVVPVPRKKSVSLAKDHRLPAYMFVASELHYDPWTGFWDKPLR